MHVCVHLSRITLMYRKAVEWCMVCCHLSLDWGVAVYLPACLSVHACVRILAGQGPFPNIGCILRTSPTLLKEHSSIVPNACLLCLGCTRGCAQRPDCEWKAVVQFGVFWTNGQICSSTSRLLVQEGVAPAFFKQLKKRAESIKQCDPMTEDCRMGPVVSQGQLDKIMDFIEVRTCPPAFAFQPEMHCLVHTCLFVRHFSDYLFICLPACF